jgi:TonB family protein
MAVPAGRPATAGPAAGSVAKVLARTTAPRGDDCADPPAKPTSTSHPTPVYPETEIASGVVGKVRVEITVDEHGRVVSARILQGLGAAFDQAALAAARASTFDAAIRCGRPSASTFRISYSFRPPSP